MKNPYLEELKKLPKDNSYNTDRAILRGRAEAFDEGYKAGIKEVVEWIRQNSNETLTQAGLLQVVVTTDKWQAKLREWGVE